MESKGALLELVKEYCPWLDQKVMDIPLSVFVLAFAAILAGFIL
jgi:hypothetical protein